MLAVKCTVHDFFTCYDHDTFFWKVYPFFRKNIAKADGKVSYFFGSFLTFPLCQSCRKRRPWTQKTYSSKRLAGHKKLIHRKDWQKPCRCMTKIKSVTQDLVFCTFDDILSTGNYIQHFKLPEQNFKKIEHWLTH